MDHLRGHKSSIPKQRKQPCILMHYNQKKQNNIRPISQKSSAGHFLWPGRRLNLLIPTGNLGFVIWSTTQSLSISMGPHQKGRQQVDRRMVGEGGWWVAKLQIHWKTRPSWKLTFLNSLNWKLSLKVGEYLGYLHSSERVQSKMFKHANSFTKGILKICVCIHVML